MAHKSVTIDAIGTMSQYVAEIMPITINEALKDYEGLRSRLTVEERVDYLSRRMIYTLRAYVAGNQERVDYRTRRSHASWWEHFKDEVMPTWFTRRYPVRFLTEEIKVSDITRMCPHLPINTNSDWKKHAEWLCYEIDAKNQKD